MMLTFVEVGAGWYSVAIMWQKPASSLKGILYDESSLKCFVTKNVTELLLN